MDADLLKAIVAIVSAVMLPLAGLVRWAVLRVTKAIDESSAAHLVAAKEAAAAQLAAAEKVATSQVGHAVAFAELRTEIRAVHDFIADRPRAATGSGARPFTSDR